MDSLLRGVTKKTRKMGRHVGRHAHRNRQATGCAQYRVAPETAVRGGRAPATNEDARRAEREGTHNETANPLAGCVECVTARRSGQTVAANHFRNLENGAAAGR